MLVIFSYSQDHGSQPEVKVNTLFSTILKVKWKLVTPTARQKNVPNSYRKYIILGDDLEVLLSVWWKWTLENQALWSGVVLDC